MRSPELMPYDLHWWVLAFRADWVEFLTKHSLEDEKLAFQFMADEALMRQEFGYCL